MTGWTRDLVGFHHHARTTNPTALVRGAALWASIALEQAHPAPDERDYAAIRAIHAEGRTWGLPAISDTPDEPMQVWTAWVGIYAQVRAANGDDPSDKEQVERMLRHDFLFYLHTVRQDLAELGQNCLAGHPEIGPNWLAELHMALVHTCGWSVAELVTHVMALHRRDFPHCVKRDDALIAHVTSFTPALEPPTED